MAMINFCFDQLGTNPRLGYPNLAADNLAPDQFDTTWPHVLPLRLLMYFDQAGIEFRCHNIAQAPAGSWYPIALGWHNHSIDYFQLLSATTLTRLRAGDIKILFYYHEGDNPAVISKLINQAVHANNLPNNCYLFVSANTAASKFDNFYYFDDHEYFFRYINRRQVGQCATNQPREYQFTALNRTHKWWRASVMSDLWSANVLTHSRWSYNTECLINDSELDNPLELDRLPNWRSVLSEFLANGPYLCDQLDSAQHNDHRSIELDLYSNSYCHLVIETHYDADGSNGAFLTEKTYKCIKYGQPFVVIGTPGSLAVLRSHGYRVFDHVIDNRYDEILHNTNRWTSLRQVIADLSKTDLHSWYLNCLEDIRYNQQLFDQRRRGPDLLQLAQTLST